MVFESLDPTNYRKPMVFIWFGILGPENNTKIYVFNGWDIIGPKNKRKPRVDSLDPKT